MKSSSISRAALPQASATLSSRPQLPRKNASPCTLPVPVATVSFRARTSSLWDVEASATAFAMITRSSCSVVVGVSWSVSMISASALGLIEPF